MTQKFLGDRLAPGTVGPRQVPALPATRAAQPPLPVKRWLRNGKAPDATFESMKAEAANQAALFRTKCVFSAYGKISVPAPVGNQARWRWAFHTGPYAHALYATVHMRSPQSGLSGDSYARIDIENTGGAVVASKEFHYGVAPGGSGTFPGFLYNKTLREFLDVSPDTDYTATMYTYNNALIVGCSVVELQSMTENYSGYLAQNITAQSPILDVYRQNLATVSRALWRRGGAQVLNWTQDLVNGYTTFSATPANVIDGSTTPTSSTFGYTINMTGKDRLSQTTGVPCVMKAHGKVVNGFIGANGAVYLKDSTGTTVASITGFSSTTASWRSTTLNLPATTDKYDIYFAESGGVVDTFQLNAVSIYEYEA